MTASEEAVLVVVERFIGNHGYPPTLAEIAILCEFSSRTSAHTHVWSLIGQGYLAGAPGRTLRLGDRPRTSAAPGSPRDS